MTTTIIYILLAAIVSGIRTIDLWGKKRPLCQQRHEGGLNDPLVLPF